MLNKKAMLFVLNRLKGGNSTESTLDEHKKQMARYLANRGGDLSKMTQQQANNYKAMQGEADDMLACQC